MSDEAFFKDVIAEAPNRRSFVRKLGIAGAALGAAATAKGQTTTTSGITDVDILNFALNLEYLEADFYTIALTGQPIESLGYTVTGIGTAGSATGGSMVDFTTVPYGALAQSVGANLASDERDHVALLQQTITSLGAQFIARPAINLNALGFGFASVADYLKLGRIFEDIGVTAYAGASNMIQNSSVLLAAARILAVEGEHSGVLRLQLAMNGIATTPPLDGADILPPPSGTLYIPVNTQGIVETRTPQQVLFLAYNGANLSAGGFFPNGVNGTITMSAAAAATYDGATLTASPNPITVTGGPLVGATTLTWTAPDSTEIEIHLGSPTGPLFTQNVPSGSMVTGNWVTNGLTFYLQDVSNGAVASSANTLATVTVTVSTSTTTTTTGS